MRSLYDVLICPDKNCMNMHSIDMVILSREMEPGLILKSFLLMFLDNLSVPKHQ